MMRDRPISDPSGQFLRLVLFRVRLVNLADRYPSRNADWRVLQEVIDALDRSAIHFGLDETWWWPGSSHGGKIDPRVPRAYLGPDRGDGEAR